MSKHPAVHKSTAFIQPIAARHRGYGGKTEPISRQFRFVIRMAYACHERGVPYNVLWARHEEDQISATILAVGAVPTPRALPKPPAEKPLAFWKPTVFEAVYRLDAYSNGQGKCPGFVIGHSSGLCLVHPSDSGELGMNADGQEDDIRENWRVTHRASGQGFGVTLTFKKAVEALILAASYPVDWKLDIPTLAKDPQARRANYAILARYGNPSQREHAKHNLDEIEKGQTQ